MGVIVPAQALQREREVVIDGWTLVRRERLLVREHRVRKTTLAREDQPDEEVRAAVVRPQLGDAAELAQRFLEHAGLVERDAEVAVFFDALLGERWTLLVLREAFFGVRRFEELRRKAWRNRRSN